MPLMLKFDVQNKASSEVNKLQKDLDKLKVSTKGAETSFGGLASSIPKVAGAMAVAYTAVKSLEKGYDLVIKKGFAYNKLIEEQVEGLKALAVATSSNIDSMGDTLTLQQKYNLAGKEAVKTFSELRKINAETPHTLGQTAQIYKAMYPSMKNVGASTKDLIKLTKTISIASAASGIEFRSLLASVDGLANGTVLANSDLGRLLKALGLTNEKIKESKNVTELLNEAFKEFKGADTMAVSVSKLENAWNDLSGTLTKDIFEASKGYLDRMSRGLDKVTLQIKDYKQNIETVSDIGKITDLEDLNREIGDLEKKLKGLESIDTKFMWNKDKDELKSQIDDMNKLITLAKNYKVDLQLSENDATLTNKPKEKTDEEIKLIKKMIEVKTQLEYDYISDKWDAEEALEDEKLALVEKYIKYKSDLEYQAISDKWDAEEELAEEAIKTQKLLASFLNNSYSSMLDSQIELAESTNDWNDNLEGVAGTIQGLGKVFAKFNVDNLKATKAQFQLDEKYKKFTEDNKLNDIELTQLNTEYLKEKSAIDKQNTQNQIAGYGQLAGAMSQAFAKGSAEAEAMIVVTKGLALVNAVASVMAGGKTATAYEVIPSMLAVGATAISFLSQIGVGMSGSGGTVDSSYDTSKASSGIGYSKASTYAQINQSTIDYGSADFEAFTSALSDASKALENFGNIGTVSAKEIEALEIAKNRAYSDILKAQAEYDYLDSLPMVLNSPSLRAYMQGAIDNFQAVFDSYADEWSNAVLDIVSDTLDFSRYSLTELNNIVPDSFNMNNYNMVIDELNSLALKQKELQQIGQDISESDKSRIIELTAQGGVWQIGKDYADAIELINDALEDSTDNIKSWKDSFKTNEELASDLSEGLTYITQEAVTQMTQVGMQSIRVGSRPFGGGIYQYVPIFKEIETLVDTINDVSLVGSMEELSSLFTTLSTDVDGLTNAELDFLNANRALIEARVNERDSLQETYDLLIGATTQRELQLASLDDSNKALQEAIWMEEDRQKAISESQTLIDSAVANFTSNMESMAGSIDSTINTIKGNMLDDSLTTEQIRRLNLTQRAFETSIGAGDSDKAKELLSEITTLATGISSGAFGDTSKINQNLISSLEANKAMIDFKDEVLMVRIVASDLDYTQATQAVTPSVYVTNSTNNDDRLATLEAIMTEVLKTNINVYDLLLRIQNNGLKTI